LDQNLKNISFFKKKNDYHHDVIGISTMADKEEEEEEAPDGSISRVMIRHDFQGEDSSSSSAFLEDSLQRLQMVRLWSQDEEDLRQHLQPWTKRGRRLLRHSRTSKALSALADDDDSGTGTGKCIGECDGDAKTTKSDDAGSAWGETPLLSSSSQFWAEKENVASLLLSKIPSPGLSSSTSRVMSLKESSSSPPPPPHRPETSTTTKANSCCSLRRASPAAKNALLRLSRKVGVDYDDETKSLRRLVVKSPSPSSSSSSSQENDDEQHDSVKQKSGSDCFQSSSSLLPSSHALFQLTHLIAGGSSCCYCGSSSRREGENGLEKEEEEANSMQQVSGDASHPKSHMPTNPSLNHQMMTTASRQRLVRTALGLLIFSVLTLWRLYCNTGGGSSRNRNSNNILSTTTTTPTMSSSRTTTSLATTTTICIKLLVKRLQQQALLLCLPFSSGIQRFTNHVMMRAMIHQAIASARKVLVGNGNNNNHKTIVVQRGV
jgi:hypothetical protein